MAEGGFKDIWLCCQDVLEVAKTAAGTSSGRVAAFSNYKQLQELLDNMVQPSVIVGVGPGSYDDDTAGLTRSFNPVIVVVAPFNASAEDAAGGAVEMLEAVTAEFAAEVDAEGAEIIQAINGVRYWAESWEPVAWDNEELTGFAVRLAAVDILAVTPPEEP